MQALVRHSMDPVAMLAGARRLDGRIQRQEVRLVGDFIDDLSMQGGRAASGAATVPQVFLDGKLVGGPSMAQSAVA